MDMCFVAGAVVCRRLSFRIDDWRSEASLLQAGCVVKYGKSGIEPLHSKYVPI